MCVCVCPSTCYLLTSSTTFSIAMWCWPVLHCVVSRYLLINLYINRCQIVVQNKTMKAGMWYLPSTNLTHPHTNLIYLLMCTHPFQVFPLPLEVSEFCPLIQLWTILTAWTGLMVQVSTLDCHCCQYYPPGSWPTSPSLSMMPEGFLHEMRVVEESAHMGRVILVSLLKGGLKDFCKFLCSEPDQHIIKNSHTFTFHQ